MFILYQLIYTRVDSANDPTTIYRNQTENDQNFYEEASKTILDAQYKGERMLIFIILIHWFLYESNSL